MKRLAAAIAFQAVLAAASTSAADAPADGRLIADDQVPRSVWAPRAEAVMAHTQSGLICPLQFRAYTRTHVELFDRFGLDVGCDYLSQGTSDITVYLTRRETSTIADAIAEAQRELMDYRSEVKPQRLSEGQQSAGGLDFDVTLYSLGNARSAIWIADFYGWTLEFRATYRTDAEPQVLADLAAMTDAVKASAGPRLATCAKAETPARTGTPAPASPDREIEALLSVGAAAAAQNASQAPAATAATPAEPVLWCVRQAMPGEPANLLFWQGVLTDGEDARTDRVTAITLGAPSPELVASGDPTADVVQTLAHRQPHWQATLDTGQKTSVYGFFTGRPKPEALAALFRDIIAGKAQALSSYDRSGKNIEIALPPAR